MEEDFLYWTFNKEKTKGTVYLSFLLKIQRENVDAMYKKEVASQHFVRESMKEN